MQIIKPLLIICFVVLLVAVFRHRSRAGLRAGSRVVAVGLVFAAVVAIMDPDIPQHLAELVGVARGTDLILYGLVVVFAVSSLALYFQQRESDVRLQMLARRVALSDAVSESGPPGAPADAAPVAAGERLELPDAQPDPHRLGDQPTR